MGWITDDGRHEGYLVPEFRDGQRGRGITGGGVPLDEVIVEVDYFREPPYETRPASEVIGWRVTCDCSAEDGRRLLPESERWQGDLITRVAFAQAEDLSARRVYAAESDVVGIQDRTDVSELAQAIWRDEHVRHADALRILKDTRTRAALANRDLERAVATARALGVNPYLISEAARLPRIGRVRTTAHTGTRLSPVQRARHLGSGRQR